MASSGDLVSVRDAGAVGTMARPLSAGKNECSWVNLRALGICTHRNVPADCFPLTMHDKGIRITTQTHGTSQALHLKLKNSLMCVSKVSNESYVIQQWDINII